MSWGLIHLKSSRGGLCNPVLTEISPLSIDVCYDQRHLIFHHYSSCFSSHLAFITKARYQVLIVVCCNGARVAFHCASKNLYYILYFNSGHIMGLFLPDYRWSWILTKNAPKRIHFPLGKRTWRILNWDKLQRGGFHYRAFSQCVVAWKWICHIRFVRIQFHPEINAWR